MKERMHRPSIILCLVAVAFFVKGYDGQEMVMFAIGVFILVIAVLRTLLISSATKLNLNDEISEDSIKKYLNQDPVLYVEMLELYRQDHFEILYEEIDGYLFYDYLNKYYLGTAKNVEAARDIIRLLPDDFHLFITHDKVFDEAVEKDLKTSQQLIFYNCVYEARQKYNIDPKDIELRKLDASYLQIVKENYTIENLSTDEYIGACLERGMLGAFVDGELAGYIGMHDFGALGMLEVFDPYRRRNIATLLQANYIDQLIDAGYKGAIFSQVNATNEASLHLQEKLKFTQAKTVTKSYYS